MASPFKRRRFCMEPDVDVIVEGETFHLHSYVLMSQSPVFRQMLTSEMREADDGRIILEGKKKEEFRELIRQLETPGSSKPPKISPEDAQWLVVWADEYDIKGLKIRCEKVLMELPASDFDALEFATKHGLEKRRKQCLTEIASHPYKHRERIHELMNVRTPEESDDEEEHNEQGEAEESHSNMAVDTSRDAAEGEADASKEAGEENQQFFMTSVLPWIYHDVLLPEPDDLPTRITVEALWPIVVHALEMAHGWNDLEEIRAAMRRATSMEKSVLKNLPFGDVRFLQEPCLSLQTLQSRVKSDFAARGLQELTDALETLERFGAVKKFNGKYGKVCEKASMYEFMQRRQAKQGE